MTGYIILNKSIQTYPNSHKLLELVSSSYPKNFSLLDWNWNNIKIETYSLIHFKMDHHVTWDDPFPFYDNVFSSLSHVSKTPPLNLIFFSLFFPRSLMFLKSLSLKSHLYFYFIVYSLSLSFSMDDDLITWEVSFIVFHPSQLVTLKLCNRRNQPSPTWQWHVSYLYIQCLHCLYHLFLFIWSVFFFSVI